MPPHHPLKQSAFAVVTTGRVSAGWETNLPGGNFKLSPAVTLKIGHTNPTTAQELLFNPTILGNF
jgi:hypothetical protein